MPGERSVKRKRRQNSNNIVQGPLQALLSHAPPSYSKANLGITHTESLPAGKLSFFTICGYNG